MLSVRGRSGSLPRPPARLRRHLPPPRSALPPPPGHPPHRHRHRCVGPGGTRGEQVPTPARPRRPGAGWGDAEQRGRRRRAALRGSGDRRGSGAGRGGFRPGLRFWRAGRAASAPGGRRDLPGGELPPPPPPGSRRRSGLGARAGRQPERRGCGGGGPGEASGPGGLLVLPSFCSFPSP